MAYEQERARIAQRINDAFPAPSAAAAAVDPKTLFCENWDLVKNVLSAAKIFLPGWADAIIDLIIKAGDAVKAEICG